MIYRSGQVYVAGRRRLYLIKCRRYFRSAFALRDDQLCGAEYNRYALYSSYARTSGGGVPFVKFIVRGPTTARKLRGTESDGRE